MSAPRKQPFTVVASAEDFINTNIVRDIAKMAGWVMIMVGLLKTVITKSKSRILVVSVLRANLLYLSMKRGLTATRAKISPGKAIAVILIYSTAN